MTNLGYYFSSNLVFYAGKFCSTDSELEVGMYRGLEEKNILNYFCEISLKISAWKTLELCYDELSRVVRIESGGNRNKFLSISECCTDSFKVSFSLA